MRRVPVLFIGVCLLAACSGGSDRAENDARLALLRASTAARFVPPNSVLVSDHTWPLCSADSRPSGQFEKTFRVDGSADRALTQATNALARAGWRVRARHGGTAGRGVWLSREYPGWMGMAELLTNTTHGRPRLTIVFAAPSDKQC